MFKRGKTTALFIHDGMQWQVSVMSHRRGSWTILGTETAAGSALRLPEELLALAETRHARRMAVLLSSEIHTINFKTPLDADPEELQTALRYESTQSLGTEAETTRLAATNADFYSLGCDPDTWLLAAFPEERLRYFERLAQDRGLRFLGCGALELALLGWSRRNNPAHQRLLFVKETAAFYVAAGLGDAPFMAVTLSVGSRPDPDQARDQERLERSARQLAAHTQVPAQVVSCATADPAAATARSQKLLQDAGDNAWHSLPDIMAELVTSVCDDISKYAGAMCPLIGPKPPQRDPYRAGTWLFFAIVITTLTGIAANWRNLARDKTALEMRKQAWATLESARKNARDSSASLRKQRDSEIKRRDALLNTAVLPQGLLPSIETLATSMPPYTRLESLAQADAYNGLEIRGCTRWQEGLADLLQALNDTLRPIDMAVQQDAISMAEGSRHEQSFVYRIIPAEARP